MTGSGPADKADVYNGQPIVLGHIAVESPPGPPPQAVVRHKPRTWWDPCPVHWEETPARRCLRYSMATGIVLGLAAIAIVLFISLVRGEKECTELNDSPAECQANPNCRWFGEDGTRAWHGGQAYSHNGMNCAQK
eukprot:CAMPEP_0171061230 /NCGR_PEP_ID=MMETSP0766_2-20121228/4306_1 /TAXON_ID=439317 /ORGANISM="Gambierdiscus australes, Strain CAWD 149" /LENGTH=134 /DNA_ID=CAMNT_0011516883 /DNA_START=26 /DNA_END=430 /DNA_ORIENTATION=-